MFLTTQNKIFEAKAAVKMPTCAHLTTKELQLHHVVRKKNPIKVIISIQ